MDAQDFRSLQEAYMDVYDEAYKPLPKEKVDRRLASKSLGAVKHQVAATWGDKNKSSENQEKANKLGSQAKKLAQISTEKNKEANSWSRKMKNQHKKEVKDKINYMDDVARQQRERGYGSTIKKEQVDLYDIILSHLLDEGYADTQEAAERIMVNMSEEWRESIVETRMDPRGRPASGPMNVYANPKGKPSQAHLDAVKSYEDEQRKKTPEQRKKELDDYRERQMNNK